MYVATDVPPELAPEESPSPSRSQSPRTLETTYTRRMHRSPRSRCQHDPSVLNAHCDVCAQIRLAQATSDPTKSRYDPRWEDTLRTSVSPPNSKRPVFDSRRQRTADLPTEPNPPRSPSRSQSPKSSKSGKNTRIVPTEIRYLVPRTARSPDDGLSHVSPVSYVADDDA
eukprot:PhF_6_TR25259/c0_g3_i1/m.34795